jgi:hypothetical protein
MDEFTAAQLSNGGLDGHTYTSSSSCRWFWWLSG